MKRRTAEEPNNLPVVGPVSRRNIERWNRIDVLAAQIEWGTACRQYFHERRSCQNGRKCFRRLCDLLDVIQQEKKPFFAQMLRQTQESRLLPGFCHTEDACNLARNQL